MLVSYFVGGAPCGSGLGSYLGHDARCSVDMVSAVVPAAIHVARYGTECQSVMVVVVGIVASLAVVIVSFVVIHLGLVFPGAVPSGIERIHRVGHLLAHQAHRHLLYQHDTVPCLHDGIDALVLGQTGRQLFGEELGQSPLGPCIAVFLGDGHIVEFKLQHLLAAQDGDVAHVGTLLVVHPVGIGIGRVQGIAVGIVVAVDVATLDMHLEVIVVAQLAREGLRRGVIRMHQIVDVQCIAIRCREGHQIESLFQAHTVGVAVVVVGHLAVSVDPAGPQLGTLLDLSLHHDIGYLAVVGIESCGIVHIGMGIVAKPTGNFTSYTIRLDELYAELLGIVAIPSLLV